MTKHHEDHEQTLVFQWAVYYPALRWLYAIPNGGKRNAREAGRLKAQGVKSGVSDICLPMVTKEYPGLYIELKRRKQDGPSRVSANQALFHKNMQEQGYKCVVCYGAEEAIAVIKDYANI